MAIRYQTIPIRKTKEGRQYYSTTLYPDVEPRDSDYYVITVRGDRLDLLAYQYYGDVNLWWIIAIANNMPQGSLYPPINTQLRIPTEVNTIIEEFQKLNSSR